MLPLKFSLNRTVEHLRLYRHILGVLIKYGFGDLAANIGRRLGPMGIGRVMPRRIKRADLGQSRARRVRLALEELGPTFIKLGQLLSTRPDLIPAEYVQEFQSLQDRVPAVKFEKIRAELERQLGAPIDQRFRRFDAQPIAAGSIAQIHRATTLAGDDVAVKIRRPGIVQTIQTECEALENLAGWIKAAMARQETIDPVRIVREFTRTVAMEVDLANERRNLRRFRRNFADDPTVHLPEIFDDYCSEGVLTMEYIEGVKPTDLEAIRAAGLDPRLLAQRGANFVLRQIFEFGLFQADPHPGNFFVLPGNVLAPLDLGQVARLHEKERFLFGEFVRAILDEDAMRLVSAFEQEDMLAEGADVEELRGDMERLLEIYHDLPVKEIPFGRMMLQTFELFRRHRLRPPAEFAMMLKSTMTIESLATALDSDFHLAEYLRPHARRLRIEQADPRRLWRRASRALQETGGLLASLPADIKTILRNLKRGRVQIHIHHEHLENLVHTLDKSSNRISFALIIAGLLVGSSLLVTQTDGAVMGLMRLHTLGVLGYVAAAVLGLWLLLSIIRSRHL